MNYSDKSEFHVNRAFTFYELNRYESCIEEAQLALSHEPEHEFAFVLAIMSYSALKNFKRASELGNDALKIHADSDQIHYAIGTANLRAGNVHPAGRHLQIAVQKNPYNPSYLTNLGIAFWNVNKQETAMHCFDKALEITPNNDFILNLKSRLQNNQKNTSEALGTINQALKIDPEDSDNHLVKGQFEMAQRNYETAANHFKEALRLNPLDIQARTQYIESLFLSDKNFELFDKFYPAPRSSYQLQLFILILGVLLFNYFVSTGSITSPPQIWVWLLMTPFVLFWILKPYFKLQLYQEHIGEHPLEDTDPALPITFNAVIVVLLAITYGVLRNDFFAWWSSGLAIGMTIAANVIMAENPTVSVPVFKNPWKSFWSILFGSLVAMTVFYRLSWM